MRHVRAILAAAVLGASSAVFAGGTVHQVLVGPGNTYTPANITIEAGDTIDWVWVAGIHGVSSGEGGLFDGLFNSGLRSAPWTYSFTFTQAFVEDNPRPDNRYPYYCAPHWQQGMIGSVTVIIPEPACPADLNNSGAVYVQDLLILLGEWGPCKGCESDLNGSGAVDVQDLLLLLGAWGPC
ncbi:MAG TPA: plastocyanin/azurin family copper-binding protein [Phycisphaerales bacterium]|nr:plastocyanin/azurin family copper-binding protein [Phycisphaerales bacterium]